VTPFELLRRAIAQGGVLPLLVVDLIDELVDGGQRFGQIPVFLSINLLVLTDFTG
jgi:hypothetical protein